ncbi:hypothetical protein [Candidatus Accumulibacter vicinus]|uniref:Uncharacterized protein n=1 Tax=Candidatus Accumulibacter vicinus TaxID=2954382 RepID=A0A084XZG2_9PROT|nr:hypothetical protein [Candidatus Accumulibacter vicinus]KFB67856.1 MAG: hypothetical protein CAPSK01_002444 [Candidatus Accumulibacter vicinus]
MSSQSLPLADPQLADAAAALAEWRSPLPRSSRIPEELWSRAIALAERHGVAKVAVALKLDYTSRKRRLTRTGKRPVAGERSVPQSPAFVELDFGLALAPAACVLVLSDRHGRALRIELPRAASSDIAEVARSLWQART